MQFADNPGQSNVCAIFTSLGQGYPGHMSLPSTWTWMTGSNPTTDPAQSANGAGGWVCRKYEASVPVPVPAPAPNPTPAPAPNPAPNPTPAPSTPNTPTGGGVSADPHGTSLGGGKWDLRGKDDTSFALWAAAKLHVNGMTKERTFKKKGGQIVHGSCFVRVACKVAVDADTTLHVQLLAEQPSSFRMYLNDNATGLYANRTNVELSDVSLSITPKKGDFVLIDKAIKVLIQWRQFRAPLNAAGQTVPENDQSRWYLDVSFRALNGTMPAVAPHGLIGQSFDGSTLTVHGKRDNYGRGRFFKTSAQGEGAIEGTYTDYIVASPFATSFKFARFGSLGPVAPRNVSMLTGRKEPKVVGVAAGSVEDADA